MRVVLGNSLFCVLRTIIFLLNVFMFVHLGDALWSVSTMRERVERAHFISSKRGCVCK